MSGAPGPRRLLLGVAAVTALFLLVARGASRFSAGTPGAGETETPAGRPSGRESGGAAVARPPAEADLGFYRSLASPRPQGRAAAPGDLNASASPRPEPAPGGAWIVQALATRDERTARRLRDRLAGRGLPAALLEGSDANGPVYRVRLGRWRDREAAEAVAGRLRKELRLDPWVLREDG
jgi:cell division septation protein DedD